MLGRRSEASDKQTLHTAGSTATQGAADMLQGEVEPLVQPGTSRDVPRLDNSNGPSSQQSLPWPPRMLVAPRETPIDSSSSCRNQCPHVGCGDSPQHPAVDHPTPSMAAADHQSGNNASHERMRRIQGPIRQLAPPPWNLSPRRTHLRMQELRRTTQGRSLGNGTHTFASRRTESGVAAFNVSPWAGGTSRDRVGTDPNEGGLFGFDQYIPGSFTSVRPARDPADGTISVQGAHEAATNSTRHGGPGMAPPGAFLFPPQVRGPFIPRSQRTPTVPAITSFARQAAAHHGALRPHFEVISELRQNGGVFGGLPRLPSQRAPLRSYQPSTSSFGSRFTPLGHPPRAAHGRRHFRAPQASGTPHSPPPVLPRPPFNPRPGSRWRSSPPPTMLQELGPSPQDGSPFPPHPDDMASFEPPASEGRHPRAVLREDFFRVVHGGIRRADLAKLRAYPFDPEVHEQISCVVCMSSLESEEFVRVLPCAHEFHAACVDKWLWIKRTCPTCRWDASRVAPPSTETT